MKLVFAHVVAIVAAQLVIEAVLIGGELVAPVQDAENPQTAAFGLKVLVAHLGWSPLAFNR